MKYLEKKINISQTRVDLDSFIKILKLIEIDKCTSNDAKRIFKMIWDDEVSVEEAIKERYREKEKFSDENLKQSLKKVLGDHPKQVEQYLGKKVVWVLVGQVRKAFVGKADPKRVGKMILKMNSADRKTPTLLWRGH